MPKKSLPYHNKPLRFNNILFPLPSLNMQPKMHRKWCELIALSYHAITKDRPCFLTLYFLEHLTDYLEGLHGSQIQKDPKWPCSFQSFLRLFLQGLFSFTCLCLCYSPSSLRQEEGHVSRTKIAKCN